MKPDLPAGFAVLCDLQGAVVQVLRDDLALGDRIAPGQTLTHLVDRGSLSKALSFLVEIRAQGAAFDWEMNVADGEPAPGAAQSASDAVTSARTLHFIGGVVAETMLIAGAASSQSALRLYAELLRVGGAQAGSEQANRLRTAGKERIEAPPSPAGVDHGLFDDISRLNNELVNLQRERAKLNAEMEQRVADRTAELAARTAQLEAANRELHESLTKYRVLFESFPLGLTIANAQGQIIESNPRADRLLGLTREDQERRKIDGVEWQIIRPDGTLMPAAEFSSVRALQEQRLIENVEMGLVKDRGEITWISVTAAPLPLPGFGVAIAYGDVTAHRQAEIALRESEARFRGLFESSINGAALHELVLNEQGEPVDYITLAANPAYEVHTGLRVADVVGKRITQILPGTDTANLVKTYGKVALTGEPVSLETYFEPLQRHFLISAYQVGRGRFAAVFENITARKQAELALRESEGRFRSVLENSQDAAYRRNLQIDQYDYMSPVIEQITGWTAEEMMHAETATLLSRIHPDDLAGAEQELERTLAECRAGGRATSELDYRFLCKDGQYRWVADRYYVVADAAGQPCYRGGVFQDITERKQAEAQQREMEVQMAVLHQMDRLRAELIGNVSHELRTPLGLILVMVTALRKERLGANLEVRDRFLQDIEEETRNLQGIVDNLLDESHLQSGRLELDRRPMDVWALISKTVELQALKAPHHRLIHHLPETELLAAVDARRIEQVLRNLLDNAVKYSPAGTTITVWAGAEAEAFPLRVTVSDEGPGIPPAERERIFERFYRVVDPQGAPIAGLGLGLSICRGLVEAHGGRLWVEERPGGGSVFVFTLPRGTDATGPGDDRRRPHSDRRRTPSGIEV